MWALGKQGRSNGEAEALIASFPDGTLFQKNMCKSPTIFFFLSHLNFAMMFLQFKRTFFKSWKLQFVKFCIKPLSELNCLKNVTYSNMAVTLGQEKYKKFTDAVK